MAERAINISKESSVVEILQNMFGDKIAFDLICGIVENCEGNLQRSVDAILSIFDDDFIQIESTAATMASDNNRDSQIKTAPQSQLSYANVSKSVNTSEKIQSCANRSTTQTECSTISSGCEEEVNQICSYHNLGYKTLIIMRGLPGSGKSFLSRHIVDLTVGPSAENYKAHIFSADDFFVMKGYYHVSLVSEAHQWNKEKVRFAIRQGLSPIIVDNTNTELWEMEVYVRDGVKEGYYIIVIEPKTTWARNVAILAKKNIHGVNLQKLKKMKDRFMPISKENIMQEFGLKYPVNKVPPVLRAFPLFSASTLAIPSIAQDETATVTETSVDIGVDQNDGAAYPNKLSLISNCANTSLVTNSSKPILQTSDDSSFDRKLFLKAGNAIINLMSNRDFISARNEFDQISNSITLNPSLGTEVSVTENSEESKMSTIQLNPFTLSATDITDHNSQTILSTSSNTSNPKPICDESTFPVVNVTPQNAPDVISNLFNDNEIQELIQNPGGSLSVTHQNLTNYLSDQLPNCTVSENIPIFDCKEEDTHDDEMRFKRIAEAEKQIEEIKKIEDAWDMEGDWVKNDNKNNATEIASVSHEPKPQRKKDLAVPCTSETLMPLIANSKNWQDIEKIMPPWDYDSNDAEDKNKKEEVTVETASRGTIIDIDDWTINGEHKILSTFNRDINMYYIPPDEIMLQKKTMLDRSTQVDEDKLYNAYACKNESKHFKALRKIFNNIPKSTLKDIFRKCHGNVHWSIELLLEAGNCPIITVLNPSDDDTDSEDDYDCNCFKSGLDKVPDHNESIPDFEEATITPSSPSVQKNKSRKGKAYQSETSLELQKQLEQNVVISDSHYTEHCLKIRKMRRGELSNMPGTSSQPDDAQPGPSVVIEDQGSEEDNDEISNKKDVETVNVNLGREFIEHLDNIFNRNSMYSENIVPMVNMPVSILHQINALWLESYAHQLHSQAAYLEILVSEDRELARQLAEKEAELAREGKEPEVPDFKEIMDMDLALSVYKKDITERKNTNEPNDIAAKMTRDKLFNLFPELSSETLAEVLMAHENNFQATVETLLMSTGQVSVLQEENGVNKFVMNREMERQKVLEEKRRKEQTLNDDEWPLITKLTDEIDMGTAEQYRNEALQHLERRNLSYQKAQDFMRRGMTQIAAYYSDLASYHKREFELANTHAASSFIQCHAANGNKTTLDLHYLFVSEAIQALDMFLDHHIQALRNRVKDFDERGSTVSIYLITGRGLHSKGGPRIKPATKRRLKTRNLIWSELNPGLLCVPLTADNLLTHQIPQ